MARTDAPSLQREQEATHQQQTVIREEVFQGPLPHPEMLAKYEEVYPGSAGMILANFNEQSIHRREAEKLVVAGSERRADRGQLLAAGLIALGVLAGVGLGIDGEGVAAGITTAASIGSGAIAYVVGGRPPKERPPASRDT